MKKQNVFQAVPYLQTLELTMLPAQSEDGQTGGQTGGQTLLTEAQLVVYNILKRDNMASRQSIADNLGINPFAVQKHMDSLKKSGYIQRVGIFKGYWGILK